MTKKKRHSKKSNARAAAPPPKPVAPLAPPAPPVQPLAPPVQPLVQQQAPAVAPPEPVFVEEPEAPEAPVEAMPANDSEPVSTSPLAGSVPPPSATEVADLDDDDFDEDAGPPTEREVAADAVPSDDAPREHRSGEATARRELHKLRVSARRPNEKRASSSSLEAQAEQDLGADEDGDGEALEVDAIEPPRSSGEGDEGDVADRIRELEERIDRMIDEAAQQRSTESARPRAPSPSTARLPDDDEDANVFDTARELLSSDFYLRKWGRLGMRNRSEEVDDFGFDPVYEEKVLPFFRLLYERYFRVETDGIANIPATGRCLLVANHSGTIPLDGLMMKLAVKREHPQPRDVRWLAEDFIFHFPFLGSFTNRVGAVRACQENAERLLAREALVAVFPEGVKGIGKLFGERYRLQRFGRGGFVKLCLRTRTPIVPVAVVGAEEANPMLMRLEYLTKAIGLPYLPITPTFPWLGPLGLIPAPTKWRILFGEPITFDGHGPEAADDEILVGRLSERVRATIQGMLDHALSQRRSVFFG